MDVRTFGVNVCNDRDIWHAPGVGLFAIVDEGNKRRGTMVATANDVAGETESYREYTLSEQDMTPGGGGYQAGAFAVRVAAGNKVTLNGVPAHPHEEPYTDNCAK